MKWVACMGRMSYEAAAIASGAGEGAWALWTLCISTSAPLLLLLVLLGSAPLSLFSLLLLPSAEASVESSASRAFLFGAVQRGTSQTTPVKLLSVKPPLAHLRQGLPDLSRALRPALMAPWLALGPSL
jgi:hypothetical protein